MTDRATLYSELTWHIMYAVLLIMMCIVNQVPYLLRLMLFLSSFCLPDFYMNTSKSVGFWEGRLYYLMLIYVDRWLTCLT